MWLNIIFHVDDSASEKTKADESLTILLVFGGMDTQGEIFNDCLVLMPEYMKWKVNNKFKLFCKVSEVLSVWCTSMYTVWLFSCSFHFLSRFLFFLLFSYGYFVYLANNNLHRCFEWDSSPPDLGLIHCAALSVLLWFFAVDFIFFLFFGCFFDLEDTILC